MNSPDSDYHKRILNNQGDSSDDDLPVTDQSQDDSLELGSIEFTRTGAMRSKKIDRYLIQREIGSGSMGRVFLALDSILNRPVALKILLPAISDDEVALERFHREARYAASLQHPLICAVFDMGEWRSQHFISMQYIAGQTFSDYRLSHPALSQKESIAIILKLAEAIQYAHSKNVLHRDLKPANVIITEAGPILTDFGMARHIENHLQITDTDESIGTIAYMPLEQLRAEHDQVGPHSDVYSLGVMLFECLARRLPFEGDVFSMMRHIIHDEAPHLREIVSNCDPMLDSLCQRMLAKNPDARISSMSQVIEVLTAWLDSERRRSLPIPFGDSAGSYEPQDGLLVTELHVTGKRPRLMTPDRPFLIGRDERGTDLQINRPEISRRHALLVCANPHQPPTLIDLNSRRGVFLNEKPISSAILEAQGSFQLGSVNINYTCVHWEETIKDYVLGPYLPSSDRVKLRKAMRQSSRNELVRLLKLSEDVLAQLGGAAKAQKILPTIQHPNLAQTLAVFSNEEQLYLVQRWIHQRNVKDYRQKHGCLPVHLVIKLGKELSLALDYCESLGMIHGAISPETLYVSSRRRTVLGDFVFPQNKLNGKQHPFPKQPPDHLMPFFPPERTQAPHAYGIHSDLYSVGAVLLWCMMSNEREFQRHPSVALENFIAKPNPHYSDEVREQLGRVFMKAMQPVPQQRFQSVLEFRQAWKAATTGIEV